MLDHANVSIQVKDLDGRFLVANRRIEQDFGLEPGFLVGYRLHDVWPIEEAEVFAAMRSLGFFTLDVLYARAKAKMWAKVERLRELPGLRISDFGTRRRHSFLWQRWCVEALKEGIGPAFTGTSNVLLAMDSDLEAVGTNAHELPMVFAALTENLQSVAAQAVQRHQSRGGLQQFRLGLPLQ